MSIYKTLNTNLILNNNEQCYLVIKMYKLMEKINEYTNNLVTLNDSVYMKFYK